MKSFKNENNRTNFLSPISLQTVCLLVLVIIAFGTAFEARAQVPFNYQNFSSTSGLNRLLGSAALQCVVKDDFNRADSTNMGANWTEASGNISILNNRAVGTNQSAMSFTGAASGDKACVDVYAAASGVQEWGGVYLKWTAINSNLFVVAVDNDGNGNFDRIFFMRDGGFVYNQACQGGFNVSSPFTSARLSVYLDGTTLKGDIDTNFDNTPDQSYSCAGAPERNGTLVALGFYGAAALDNFGTPPQTITVTKTADTNDNVCDADCSLREAIFAAQSGDTIQFASPLFDTAQTINVNGQLVIDKSLTINGRGANLTTVRNVAAASGTSRVFLINSGTTVNLNGLTITGGNLTAGVATNSCGSTTPCGGGINNSGNLTITGSVVSGNSITGSLSVLGGGIYSIGSLTIAGSTISGNSVSGNFALGGGIHLISSSYFISNSTISGNLASANSSAQGGGINVNSGTLNITNSTVTNNSTNNNIGGGVATNNIGTINAVNTIISGNFAPNSPDLWGSLSGSSTNNLIGGNVRLLPLGNYGGATPTHALLPDSPAINAGSDCVIDLSCASANPPFSLTTDQRGAGFPRKVGASVDIGAFEAPASLVVTNTNDSGSGSLRAAITAANADPAYDAITFNIPSTDAGCTNGVCTITLTSGELSIAGGSRLLIDGTDAKRLAVSGNNASRIFNAFLVSNLIIRGLTLRNGSGSGNGGAVSSVRSFTTLQDTIVTSNTANNAGGGVYSCGDLSVINSSIVNNVGASVGGILILDAAFCIDVAVVTRIINSTVSGNRATTDSVAAIGGISVGGQTILINSTVTGNTASTTAIAAAGGLRHNGGIPIIRNTIIAGNTGSSPDINGSVNSQGNNLIGNTTGANITGDTTGNITNVNARLAPLGFYGGTTMTHALLSNSPAINAGNNCVTNLSCSANNPPVALTTDQRGASRIGQVDIGAFELNSSQNMGNFVAQLPGGTQFVSYNYTLIPEADSTTYCISAGNLPSGLSGIPACLPPLADGDSSTKSELVPSAAVSISGTPTQSGTFNFSVTATNGGNTNVTDFTLNILGPTAANVSVSGRVLTNDGRGLRNAIVVMTDSQGETRTTRSNAFGYFRFTDVGSGETYVFDVRSKQFTFIPQVLYIAEDLTNLNFTGQ